MQTIILLSNGSPWNCFQRWITWCPPKNKNVYGVFQLKFESLFTMLEGHGSLTTNTMSSLLKMKPGWPFASQTQHGPKRQLRWMKLARTTFYMFFLYSIRLPTKVLGTYPVLLFSMGSHTQDKISDQAPAGPELMDGMDDPNKPNPPVLGAEVSRLVFIFGPKEFFHSFIWKDERKPNVQCLFFLKKTV